MQRLRGRPENAQVTAHTDKSSAHRHVAPCISLHRGQNASRLAERLGLEGVGE